MIVRDPEDGEILLFRQPDHAELAGEFAARLVDAPEPLGPFVSATRLHDNGWREGDAVPLLDAETGRPHDYTNMPRHLYRDIWRRGIDRAVEIDPYVGLLVILHGARFFRHSKKPEGRELFESERARADGLLADLGMGGEYDALPEPVESQSDWMAFCDGLSLFSCERWRSPWDAKVVGRTIRVERAHEDDREALVRLDPFPFRAPFERSVPYRAIPARRYGSQDELDEAFREGRRGERTFRYAPA